MCKCDLSNVPSTVSSAKTYDEEHKVTTEVLCDAVANFVPRMDEVRYDFVCHLIRSLIKIGMNINKVRFLLIKFF